MKLTDNRKASFRKGFYQRCGLKMKKAGDFLSTRDRSPGCVVTNGPSLPERKGFVEMRHGAELGSPVVHSHGVLWTSPFQYLTRMSGAKKVSDFL